MVLTVNETPISNGRYAKITKFDQITCFADSLTARNE
jgi:hypothetical protein